MIPPVSMTSTSRPFHRAFPYNRSRVMPGSSPTIDLRLPIRRLKRVLLPTLGRPTIASTGRCFPAAGGSGVSRLEGDFGNGSLWKWIRPPPAGFSLKYTVMFCRASQTRAPAAQHQVIIETRSALLVRGRARLSSVPQNAIAPQAAKAIGSLYSFFAPGGALSRSHPAYEFRRGQLQMAEAVEQAIADKRHLLVEAGTGTGKTLAYLLPAIRSRKRVIVSTGTKNLQEQLFYKDVPFLEQVLFPNGEGKLRVCYMKGRNNYLCRQKLYDLKNQPILRELAEVEQYRAIAEWEQHTETGDRAEIAGLPEASALWHKIDARSDACTGQKCPQFDHCFITEMRRRALESDIVIVNHHLFFADLAIKRAAEAAPNAGVLPEAGIAIFDEAHELEEV